MDRIIENSEKEQEIPFMINSMIPYADDVDNVDIYYEESLRNTQGPRKKSLSLRRNVDLTLTISPSDTESLGDEPISPKTALVARNDIDETPSLPLPHNLRRNSISMPSGLNALADLENLRLKHQMHTQATVMEEEKANSTPTNSVSKIT
ncbi:hypothetical protein GQX74_011455 [Glossina fuscipes]|nr:hypothetical protein GQX74_011455 [Glossina fuscipes]